MLRRQSRETQCCRLVAAICLPILLSGCGVDVGYVISAAAGQFNLLRNSISISEAIESGDFAADELAKLELITDARAYARDTLGLDVGNHFTLFYDSDGQPVAFNVSASQKDAFEPQTWWFPIVGTVPYLGFFDRTDADAEFDELAGDGLDVWMYEIDAYSLLDVLPTVLLSPMLERSEISLADVVFHELLHSTVWRPGDTTFNESLATFVGRRGAIQFLSDRYPNDPELVDTAIERFVDTDRFNKFMLALFNELEVFYTSDLTGDDKVAGREAIYQAGRDRFASEVQPLMNNPEGYAWVENLPTNNAYMLGIRRYNLDLEIFEQVFAATGEDWSASLLLFQTAGQHTAPYDYLRGWLESVEVQTQGPPDVAAKPRPRPEGSTAPKPGVVIHDVYILSEQRLIRPAHQSHPSEP